ncbi:unnamed protein product [Diatraea saccharalis]|uniref:ascorbate ferrireductase (transmembrane) n=1 Tax=Diatraea saccharalis TaxID=40085 RepID=A0A9N9WJL5_9NEOP|nr:unnamed protein product [Diatraea saccharalis]
MERPMNTYADNRDPRPSTSRQSVEKIEVFEVREHVPYQAEVTRAPTAYDEESGEMYTSWDSAWRAICQMFNLLHHMQIAIVVFCLWHFALTSAPDGGITNMQLHIIFAGTGYQLFLAEAVLTLHKHNSWSFQLSQDSKRIVHGCLQLAGSLFVLAGTFLALSEVEMNIGTAHGICGVIALAFTIVSFITGLVALFSSKIRLMIKSGPVKILHVAVGIFALSMGLISMILGFNSDFFSATQGDLSIALMIFTALTILYTILQPVYDIIAMLKNML